MDTAPSQQPTSPLGASRFPLAFSAAWLLVLTLLSAACGSDVDEAGGRALWQRLHDEDYRSWRRAPGWETPKATIRPHGELSEIFLNPTLDAARLSPSLDRWPEGSIIVKDSQSAGKPSILAALEKTQGSWYYAEWDADGDVRYAGVPDVCTHCHDAGQDQVFSLGLPQ